MDLNIGRTLRTLRHVRLSQFLYRGHLAALNLADKLLANRYRRKKSIPETSLVLIRHGLSEAIRLKQRQGRHEYTFLNRTIHTKGKWFPETAAKLWTFNLHYFGFVFEMTPSEFEEVVSSWIREVKPADKIAWHPYPISLRLPNWVLYYSAHRDELSSAFRETFLESVWNQLEFLKGRLEFHLLGNHLIANCKALIVAGTFLRDREAVTKGLEVLKRQLQEQVLEDGGHYERSPMYHCIVLADLFLMIRALEAGGETVPFFLLDAAKKMSCFLSEITVEGRIPLLNDSSSEIAPSLGELLNEARTRFPSAEFDSRGQTSSLLSGTGLFVKKGKKLSCIFDVGPIGPDFLPAHGHNDTLSFCLWMEGREVITDSGVYQYAEGDLRTYFRSAAAHNVIVIEGYEPNEIWKSFRVGRRGHPFDVSYDSVSQLARASDDSYKRLGIILTRSLRILEGDRKVEIVDEITNKGRSHSFIGRLHFAPLIVPTEIREQNGRWQLEVSEQGGPSCRVEIEGNNVQVLRTTSQYSPEFGKKCERLCIATKGIAATGKTTVRTVISCIE